MRSRGQKDPITRYLNFLNIYVESKDFDPGTISAPEWHFLVHRFAVEQRFQRDRFLPDASRESICRMIKKTPRGKVRDILIACCRRKDGRGIRSIARELMRPYSTVRDMLIRMVHRGLDGRFDRKSTGRKKILGQNVLEKITEWTRMDPSKYGFESASWRLNMVNEMIRRETGRRAKPRTLRRILRRLGLSYFKPRPVPRKTAPTWEQDTFKEKTKRMILGISGHGYAVLAVDEAGILRGASPGYGWRQAKSRDEVRTGFLTKAVRLFGALGRGRIHVKAVDRTNSETFVEFPKELCREYGRLVILLDNAAYHRYKAVDEFVKFAYGEIRLVYLPPYTPQLNPIEIQWRVLKDMLAGRYFGSADDLIRAITNLIDSGQMKPVKLMNYLSH